MGEQRIVARAWLGVDQGDGPCLAQIRAGQESEGMVRLMHQSLGFCRADDTLVDDLTFH